MSLYFSSTLYLQGRDYTASLTAGNPDLLSGTGMAVCHYLQVVSPKFSCPLDKKLANNTDIDGPASFSDLLLVLQSVTSKLSLGAELAYQAAPQIPGGHIGVLSGVAR